jgi:hypothetical protein
MLRGDYDEDHVDDISKITTPTTNASQSQALGSKGNNGNSPSRATRSIGQLSLDEVGQAFNRRCTSAITTLRKSTLRYVASVKAASNDNDMSCRAELDSHADTCGVNSVARILEYSGQVAEVSGFTNSMDSIRDVPIMKAAIAYNVSSSGETIIQIINQALYFGDQLTHILLNPNQMRSNDIQVDDMPRNLSSSSSHAIMCKDEILTIPLLLNGVISYFNVRTPSLYEIKNCQHIALTAAEE